MTPILHVRIPREPVQWKRHAGCGANSYNLNYGDKKTFRWEIQAASPMFRKNVNSRLGIKLTFWSTAAPIKKKGVEVSAVSYREDLDNMQKFIFDMGNDFIWGDDSQIDKVEAEVFRNSDSPAVEILVWEIGAGARHT